MSKPVLAAAALGLVLAACCATDWYIALPPDAVATYVGRDSCAACHTTQLHQWTGSHHDRAMELATDETVLGDFDDATFSYFGAETRFFRRDGKFFANTEGPDGEWADFEIKYTFGIEPLQQYMVEFPNGRVQVLRISWDTHQSRWFYVPPPDVTDQRIDAGDPMHWTGVSQNWNTMCAECHSTNLQKNFNLAANTYETTFSEIDVSCESCHGPGSLHVQLAESNSIFWDRNQGYALAKLKSGLNDREIDSCAPCHSRRAPLHPNYHAGELFLDHYSPSLIEPGLYHADGQILDEVYVYGSFLQSRMYAENVRCSDCHNPHSLELKFEGNKLCAQCHEPGKYDGLAHHHHTDPAATQCVACHMPAQLYMVVDDRRDHSFRIPRPDLSVELGTPNACNGCHTQQEETAEWAADAIREWYGERRPDDPHYAIALAGATRGDSDTLSDIRNTLRSRTTRDIVRATIVEHLPNIQHPDTQILAREALQSDSPLVRAAAVRAVSGRSIVVFVGEVAGRLQDPSRLVRSTAAQRLVAEADRLVDAGHSQALEAAVGEYRAGLQMMLDRAGTHINLAQVSNALGDSAAAIASLRKAIELEPYLTGPRDQLAQYLEATGSDAEEISALRTAEVELLARDTQLLPGVAAPHYRRGMLLFLLDKGDEALQAIQQACKLAPGDYENWLALALLAERLERWKVLQQALTQMETLRPGDPTVRGILQRVRQTHAREPQDD